MVTHESRFVNLFQTWFVKLIIFGMIMAAIGYVMRPFFHDGFFPTMDDVQVVRIDEMSRELESGQFPVRYVDNLGNGGGYMLFHFYAPFVYYLGAFYHMLGFPLVAATKLVFITGFLVGATGIIMLLKRYIGWVSTTIGTALFLFSVYLNYDVFTRGALTEFFAFCLLPWLFWSFLLLKDKAYNTVIPAKAGITKRLQRFPRRRASFFESESGMTGSLVMAGFTYGLLVITHNITSFTATIFLVLLLILPPISKRITLNFAFAIVIGLFLSAFFWVPVLLEQHYTVLGHTDFVTQQYKSNFLNPLQIGGLQKIPWGFKTPLLGIGLFAGLVLSITSYCSSKVKRSRELQSNEAVVRSSRLSASWRIARTVRERPMYFFAILGSVLSIVLIWSISRPLWDHLPYMKFMQFPWRYLAVTTVLAVLAIALYVDTLRSLSLKLLIGLLLLLPSFTFYKTYLRPTIYTYIGKYYAEDRCRTTTWAQEQLPTWVIACLPKNNTLPIVESASSMVSTHDLNTAKNNREITVTVDGFGGDIVIRKYYYPGWQVLIDQKSIAAAPYGIYGTMRVNVPAGRHIVEAKFKGLPWWHVVNGISLFTALGISTYAILLMAKVSTMLVITMYNKKKGFSFQIFGFSLNRIEGRAVHKN